MRKQASHSEWTCVEVIHALPDKYRLNTRHWGNLMWSLAAVGSFLGGAFFGMWACE